MKTIRYEFITEEIVEIEISDEWGEKLKSVKREQWKLDKREERHSVNFADLDGKEAADEQAEIFERMRFPFPESGSIEIPEEHNAEDAEQAVGAQLDESGDSLVVDRRQVIKPVKGQNQENISSSVENQREQMRLACGRHCERHRRD